MLNKSLNPDIFKRSIENKALRDGFGEGLALAAQENEAIVVLTADLEDSTRITGFKEKFPERFFEVGVAEQALVTVASGMAATGKIPFATSFAAFSPGRNWEQIRTTITLNNVPVKIIGSHTGLSVGEDGATHQALEDMALMRTLPNMQVVAPVDYEETKKAVQTIAKSNKPAYLRFSRPASAQITTEKTSFEIGKAYALWEEKDPQVAIVGCGPLLHEALKAAKGLSKSGIASVVVNSHTVKPLDEQTIIRVARTAGAVVALEDHQVAGGLGSAVAEVLVRNYPVPMEFIGVSDRFGQSGTPSELYREYGMTKEDIAKTVKKVLRRKNS